LSVVDSSRRLDAAALEALVLSAVATTAGAEPGALGPGTPLLAAGLDSLTLLAAFTRIELALDIAFEADELLELVQAADVRELCRLVGRKLEAQRRTKSA
jgi:hypothetical protein